MIVSCVFIEFSSRAESISNAGRPSALGAASIDQICDLATIAALGAYEDGSIDKSFAAASARCRPTGGQIVAQVGIPHSPCRRRRAVIGRGDLFRSGDLLQNLLHLVDREGA